MGRRPQGRRPHVAASQRVAEDIRMKLAQLMHRELRDPRAAGVSLTRVEMTKDLSVARAFYCIMPGGASDKDAVVALKSATGFLRRALGKSLSLRVTPELRFERDETLERGARMEGLLADKPSPGDGGDDEKRDGKGDDVAGDDDSE